MLYAFSLFIIVLLFSKLLLLSQFINKINLSVNNLFVVAAVEEINPNLLLNVTVLAVLSARKRKTIALVFD